MASGASDIMTNSEPREDKLTEAQLYDLANYFRIPTENKSPQELEQEIDQAAKNFFSSEQGEKIEQAVEQKNSGIIARLGGGRFRWLRMALAAMPIMATELPAVAYSQEGQGQKVEQRDEQKYDFGQFFIKWDKLKGQDGRAGSNTEQTDFQQETKKMLEYVLQYVLKNIDVYPELQKFKKEHPQDFSLAFKEFISIEQHPKQPYLYGAKIKSDDQYSVFIAFDIRESSVRVCQPFSSETPEDEQPSLRNYSFHER